MARRQLKLHDELERQIQGRMEGVGCFYCVGGDSRKLWEGAVSEQERTER